MLRDWEEWARCAGIRALKTAAQTAVSMLTVGQLATKINWLNVAAVSITAAVVSVLTSVAGLPEVGDKLPENWRDEEDRSGV